jgi:putative heme iron utilization protein
MTTSNNDNLNRLLHECAATKNARQASSSFVKLASSIPSDQDFYKLLDHYTDADTANLSNIIALRRNTNNILIDNKALLKQRKKESTTDLKKVALEGKPLKISEQSVLVQNEVAQLQRLCDLLR